MEANQLAPVTELSRRLVHTLATVSTEASAISTPQAEGEHLFFITHTPLTGWDVDAFNSLEKLRELSSRLCIYFFLMSSSSGNWLVEPSSMVRGEVSFPSQAVSAESQPIEDGLPPRSSDLTELAIHPRIEFGNRSVPHVGRVVRIPSHMMGLIPGASLSPSFSIELPDEFDEEPSS